MALSPWWGLFLVLLMSTEFGVVSTARGGKKGKVVIIDLSDGKNATVVEKGETVRIICVGPTEPFGHSRTDWWKDDKEIRDVQEWPRFEISRSGLAINKIKPSDAGTYQCIITDAELSEVYVQRNLTISVAKKNAGKKEVTAIADYDEEEDAVQDALLGCDNVRSAANFSSDSYLCFDLGLAGHRMSRYHVPAAGTTLTVFCNPRGNSKPSVNWYKDGHPFSQQGYHYRINNNSLIMKEVTDVDSATYTCEAFNSHSRIQYDTVVHVNLREPEIVIENILNETAVVGDDVMRSCIVRNREEFKVLAIQFVKGRGVQSEYVKVQSRTENETLLDPHILYLENVTLDDAGWYTCLVTNAIGRENVSFYIDVLTEVRIDAISKLDQEIPNIVWIASAFGGVVVVLIIIVGILYGSNRYQHNRFKNKMQQQGNTGWTKVVVVERVPARNSDDGAMLIPEVNIKSVVTNRPNGQEYELPTDERWEFSRDRLIIGKYLGEGAFGEVCQATAHGILEKGITATVAIKTLKNTHSDADMIDLISEMETMKELGKHPNIINLLGCCTAGGELLVIMEYAEHGSLLEFLRTNRDNYTYEKPKYNVCSLDVIPMNPNDPETPNGKHNLTFKDLMSYAYQVARGMDYLAQRKYVHRDLAARNVLIAANHVAKICDFGMTRSTFANDYYRKKSDGRVPIKWMAPETLNHRVYTCQSDVWSYGILLWEIVTLGGSPYPTIPDTNYLLEFIRSGQRMSHPPNCPTELYILMRDCWMDAPTARPIFGHLVEDIGRILYIASETEYFELEGAGPPEEIITPPSSPENSCSEIMFDPEFIKSFTKS